MGDLEGEESCEVLSNPISSADFLSIRLAYQRNRGNPCSHCERSVCRLLLVPSPVDFNSVPQVWRVVATLGVVCKIANPRECSGTLDQCKHFLLEKDGNMHSRPYAISQFATHLRSEEPPGSLNVSALSLMPRGTSHPLILVAVSARLPEITNSTQVFWKTLSNCMWCPGPLSCRWSKDDNPDSA